MHDAPYIQNVQIQEHINSMNPTKPWFKLLQFPLQDALIIKEHHLSLYAMRLLAKALDLSRWCIPNLQIGASVIQYHVKLYAPCGYVQISSEIKKDYTSWNIGIPLKLRVQVHFHIFAESFLQVKQATIDSNSTIANNGSILYVAYSLKMASNEKLYPNVSFNVRRFHGWNDGSCKYGGYLLVEAKYYLDDGGNYKFGPFCSKSYPTEPFVGTHGPKNIIFGKHELYIILYAFGPLYALDIDLIVVPSVCEGVFELPYSCLNSSRKQQNVVIHDNHNYQVQCSNTILGGIHEVLFAKFTFLTVVDCIIIQSIGYSRFEEEHYEILSTVNVKVTATHALPFLPLGGIDGKSRAFLSLHGVRTDFYNISHLNSSFKTTAQNILLFKLRLFQFNTHQRRAFSIYINASVKNGIPCSNSSNGQKHIGIIKGKLYKTITITSICGFILLKSTGVFIIRFHSQLSRFSGEIKHIEITKQGSNRDNTSDKQDTVTLA